MYSQSAACFARSAGGPCKRCACSSAVSSARFPVAGIEAVLLMLVKLAGDLDEIPALQRVARFVFWTVAPDPEGHAIGRVGEREFAIRFLFAGKFRRDSLELDMDTHLQRALWDGLPDFLERHQLHR